MAQSLHALAMVALRRGDAASAAAYVRDSLELFEAIAGKVGVTLCLEAAAELAQHIGDWGLSSQLLGAAAAWRTQNTAPVAPNDRVDNARLVESAKRVLGDATFEANWADGQKLTLNQAARRGLVALQTSLVRDPANIP
jgi:hypothetical protein